MASLPPSRRAPALLTIPDVAEHLQLSTKTIRRLIERGDLPSHRIDRQLRVAPNDLGALIHRSRTMVSN